MRVPTVSSIVPSSQVRAFVLTLGVAIAGLSAGWAGVSPPAPHSSPYYYSAESLLAVGLFAGTYGIDVEGVRASRRTVLVAVSFGVVLKAALVAAVIAFTLRDPAYLVLGIAVAQIDPLSVAAMTRSSQMSDRARGILTAWASFDDPVTVLLTISVSSVALRLSGHPGGIGGLTTFFLDLGLNIGFAAGIWLVWSTVARRGGRRAISVLLLLPMVVLAIWQSLMLGIAIAGLFYRPPAISRLLDRGVRVASVLATAAIGLLMANGIELVPALILAIAAYLAQVLVSLLITPGMNRDDRTYLALGQQNGITAILLAIILQPQFPRAIAIVGPAVLIVSALNLCCNGVWERLRARLPEPVLVHDPGIKPLLPATPRRELARVRRPVHNLELMLLFLAAWARMWSGWASTGLRLRADSDGGTEPVGTAHADD